MGTQWAFYDPAQNEANRLKRVDGTLHMAAKGKTPSDCSPLCALVGDQAYRVIVDIETDPGAEGGLLLFYNRRLYAGLGFGSKGLVMHRYGLQRPRGAIPGQRDPGGSDVQMEVSGYHHNVAYDFLSLRPALYAAGQGEVRFRNFTYEALS
jgi:beta-xylosidase